MNQSGTSQSDSTDIPVDLLFDETHKTLTRLRHQSIDHPSVEDSDEIHAAVKASHTSVEYINAFWPHVSAAIRSDPAKLGLSFVAPVEGQTQRVTADSMLEAFVSDPGNAGNAVMARRQGAILSSLAVMNQILNNSVAEWVQDFESDPPRCPLAFEFDAAEFVSLRMLLPHRESDGGRVAGNAPTLVMGGTATAITLCWNLLYYIPECFERLEGKAPGRDDVESVWRDTRELLFRIGSGSLTAFVALASGCASSSEAMLWDGAADLGLARSDGRFTWTASAELAARFREIRADIIQGQQEHYVGCAALYARAPALPLAPQWADEIDRQRDQVVFAELLRWITAVARRQYFSTFD